MTASLSILLTLTGLRYKLWWENQRRPKMTCHLLRKAFYVVKETFYIIIETISQKDFGVTGSNGFI